MAPCPRIMMGGIPQRARAVTIVVAICATLSSPSAQQSAPQPQQRPPTFRGGTNVVRVDVTVTDDKGRPVSALTSEDFELTEDGAVQTIDTFQLVRADGEPTDDRSLEIRSREHAATEAAREDVRLFLIFWDEYHIGQFIPATRGRDALMQFVRTAFGPTDLVAIMDQLTTLDSIRFTRDRFRLMDQVHDLKGRFGVYYPTRSAIEEGHLQYPNDLVRLRNEITMSALTAAAAFLGNFKDGRKALLFVSQGIPVWGRNNEADLFREIVRTANRNNTAIYTLDPAAEVGRRPEALLSLAYDTGGRPFVGTNRPVELLPQMVRDSSAYYLLGYSSPAPFDGKFHRIKVRLKKEGYEVRARSGHFSPTPGDMERERERSTAAELPTDVMHALDQLATRRDRALEVWVGLSRAPEGRTLVTVAWEPGPSAPADGVTAALQATGADGTAYMNLPSTATRQVSFDAPPGTVKLTTRALNKRGEELDVDVRPLTLPAFDGSRLALGTPVVLRARTPREVRTVTGGGALLPEVGREFDRSDRLFVRVPVYGGPDIALTARLLNRSGAEMRLVPVSPMEDGRYQVDLPLNASPRGDYLLAIDASRAAESTRVLVPIRVK